MRGDGMKHGARDYVERCAAWPETCRYLTKACGHVLAYQGGLRKDADSGLHPLAHAAARLMCILESELERGTDEKA
jgi:hypothetical protein